MKRSTILSSFFPLIFFLTWARVSSISHEFFNGYSADPDPSNPSFQPLLTDSAGMFSLGFLRVNSSRLVLSILHVPSSEPVWQAQTPNSARWARSTRLSFNGSLVLSDSDSGVLWSTKTNGGDVLRLLNTSNLQMLDSVTAAVLWQSFEFPSDTLVQNQNFTSAMALSSPNGLYSMRVKDDYLGLYADFNGDSHGLQLYWKHDAMEAKAQIESGLGPIYARVDSDGFMGLYQTEKTPVDVMPFASFHRGVSGLRRARLESDGNLRGYYWNSTTWVTEFEAIRDSCELPSACGPYGLCRAGVGCSCLGNRTRFSGPGSCSQSEAAGLCKKRGSDFWVMARAGVDLPYKELMGFEKMGSPEECEGSCMRNCSCWGAVFSNVTGFCYRIDYPIQTVVEGTKVGFFKVVREGEGKREGAVSFGVGAVLGIVAIGILGGGAVGLSLWWWKNKRGRVRKDGYGRWADGDGLSPGPYRDLKDSLRSESLRSVELAKV